MPSRPCRVEISTRALENNFRFLQTVAPAGAELLAIVKANAYGHSVALCAPAAVRAGARWMGVTSVEEAVTARAICPEPRIVVMGGVFAGQHAALMEHHLTAVAWEPYQLDELELAARNANATAGSVAVHLEIDSGMSRQGVSPGNLGPVLARFGGQSRLRIEAVTTHLYASDETSGDTTGRQLATLEDALSRVAQQTAPKWLSVGASAAILGQDARAIA